VLIAVLVTFGVLKSQLGSSHEGLRHQPIPARVPSFRSLPSCRSAFSLQSVLLPSQPQQEALRNIIKGKPPQTVLRPSRTGSSPRIPASRPYLLLPFFDPERSQIANSRSSVQSSTLRQRRIFAPAPYGTRTFWIF